MLGTPSVGIVRPTGNNEVVLKEGHEQYRTGVGNSFFNLVKNTQLDIENAVKW